MTLPVVQCGQCKHFHRENKDNNTCDAFAGGIPVEIIRNEFDHRKPHPQDNGIRFESIEDA